MVRVLLGDFKESATTVDVGDTRQLTARLQRLILWVHLGDLRKMTRLLLLQNHWPGISALSVACLVIGLVIVLPRNELVLRELLSLRRTTTLHLMCRSR